LVEDNREGTGRLSNSWLAKYPTELIGPGVRRSSQELVEDNREGTGRLSNSWLAKYPTELIGPGVHRSSQEFSRSVQELTDVRELISAKDYTFSC